MHGMAARRAVLALVLLFAAGGSGCLCIHYPAPANDPLTDAVEVADVPDNQTLVLRDGRRILLEIYVPELRDVIESSHNLVEIGPSRTLGDKIIQADVFVKRCSAFICGTPYAALIRIPLVPDRIVPYERVSLNLMGRK